MFNNSTAFTMPVVPATYTSGNSGNGMFGDNGWWVIIILLALFGGFGRGGFGGFGGGSSYNGPACATQADLAAGFNNSTVLSSLDDIKLGQANQINYTNQGFAGINTQLLQGFHGVDNAICTLGYQSQQGFNSLGNQLAMCCCDIQRSIDGNTTQGVMNTNSIQRQISDCCCDVEKMNMQNRFDAQAYNCNTLQAIDKLGDRIIDYMNTEKTQALRDENQALRLQASQARQNQYLIDELRPVARPAYLSCSPYQSAFGYGFNGFNNCGCGCGCN